MSRIRRRFLACAKGDLSSTHQGSGFHFFPDYCDWTATEELMLAYQKGSSGLFSTTVSDDLSYSGRIGQNKELYTSVFGEEHEAGGSKLSVQDLRNWGQGSGISSQLIFSGAEAGTDVQSVGKSKESSYQKRNGFQDPLRSSADQLLLRLPGEEWRAIYENMTLFLYEQSLEAFIGADFEEVSEEHLQRAAPFSAQLLCVSSSKLLQTYVDLMNLELATRCSENSSPLMETGHYKPIITAHDRLEARLSAQTEYILEQLLFAA